MNWDAISSIAEIIGAFVVVISLIYVAVQIRQNTDETRNLQTQNLVNSNSEANFLISSNPEVAEIIHLGMQDRDALTDIDQLRFNTFWFAAYARFDFAFHQFTSGRLQQKFWKNMDYEIPLFLSLPGSSTWWDQDKSRFTDEFVAYVDKRRAEFKAPETLPTVSGQSRVDGV